MRRSISVGLCFCFIILQVPPAHSCGDKLLVLGRTVRLRTASKPAAILAYAQPGTPVAALLENPQWVAACKKGGYRVQAIEDLSQLQTTLLDGHYDLILADISDASHVQEVVRSSPSSPLVIPLVEDRKELVRTAKKRYASVVKEHAKSGAYISAIEDALDLKAGADEARERASRKKS